MQKSEVRRVAGVAVAALLALGIVLVLQTRMDPQPASRSSRGRDTAAPRPAAKLRDFKKHPDGTPKVFEAGETFDDTAPPHPWAEYLAARGKVEAVLKSKPLDTSGNDRTLDELLADLSTQIGLPIRLTPGASAAAGKRISFQVKDLLAIHVLRLLVQQYDAHWVVDESGQIWVQANGEKVVPMPAFLPEIERLDQIRAEGPAEEKERAEEEANRKLAAVLRTARFGDGFQEVSLTTAVAEMQERCGLNMMIDRRELEDPESKVLTIDSVDGSMADAITLITALADIGSYAREGVLVFTSTEAAARREQERLARVADRAARQEAETLLWNREVGFGADNLPLREVVRLLAQSLSLPVEIDPATWSRTARISFPTAIRRAGDVLALIQRAAPVRARLRDGKLWFFSGAPAR